MDAVTNPPKKPYVGSDEPLNGSPSDQTYSGSSGGRHKAQSLRLCKAAESYLKKIHVI
jgi:hypothetical protein